MPSTKHIVIVSLFCFASSLHAQPYRPTSDDQILERLPLANPPLTAELRQLRSQVTAQPDNLELAIALSRRYLAIGRTEADPRYYGYAQGVLKPWWTMPSPPAEVLLHRALILQHRHDFTAALQDLDQLIQREPQHAQAWLTRAVILQVQANYDEAQRSCAQLVEIAEPLVTATCLAHVTSLMGKAEQSYALLEDTLTHAAAKASAEDRGWGYTVLAEMAVRLGKNQKADDAFQQALVLQPHDSYLLGAYSDFLLDQDRPETVITLLKDKTSIDGLYLRWALAKQKLQAPDLEEITTNLNARFSASKRRGENLHPGDEARFTLHLLHQAEAALPLAIANWNAQREPKDARMLLEAALAAKEPAAARPVLELLQKTAMENQPLRKLAEQLTPP